MKQSQRIFKNILAGGIGVGLGGLLQLVAIVFIARSVGVAEFGTYSFILAFAMFFQLLADSGLSNILVRELATKPERMAEILGAAVSLVWLLTALVGLLIVAAVPFLHFDFEIKALAALMGVATLAQFHATVYGSVLRSQEDNEWHALGFLLHKIVFCVCVFAGLKAGLGLLGIVLAHLVPNLFQWAFYREFIKRRYARPKLRTDFAEWKYLLTHSIPVGGATMLRLFAQQLDVIILTWLSDLHTVGLFSGPYRISQALRFIPQTMSLPLYPVYSRLAVQPETRPQFHAAYERSVKAFLVVGCAVATVFVTCAAHLITLLLGPQFRDAEPAMQLLGLAFVPFFVASPFPFLLTALHEQRFLFRTTVLSLALRVTLNFTLIPRFGFLGPSLAFLIAEIALLAVAVNRLWNLGFPLALGRMLWRPILASTALAAILHLSRGHSHAWFFLAAVAGALAYVALIFKLGTFSREELALAREGLGFLKPLIAKWTKQPHLKTT